MLKCSLVFSRIKINFNIYFIIPTAISCIQLKTNILNCNGTSFIFIYGEKKPNYSHILCSIHNQVQLLTLQKAVLKLLQQFSQNSGTCRACLLVTRLTCIFILYIYSIWAMLPLFYFHKSTCNGVLPSRNDLGIGSTTGSKPAVMNIDYPLSQ